MKKKKIFLMISIFILILTVFLIHDRLTAVQMVPVEAADLSLYAQKEVLTEDDYRFLFLQTGLGKTAIDQLRQSPDTFLEELICFQSQMEQDSGYERKFMFFPTTTADVLKGEDGEVKSMELPELKTGDIFITKSTKTLLYRHGHAAILLDAESGTLAEAMMIGTNSDTTFTDSWASYATLMILRPKADQETVSQAVTFTENHLLDVPYSLFTGLITKDLSKEEEIKQTHCSHLVWQSYKAAGLDLDSDKGPLVTPYDLSKSENLELVFCYGFGEDGRW